MEKNLMLQNPRPPTTTFFNKRELITSIIQGLMITAATLFTYQYANSLGLNEAPTRTMVFVVLISANIFLTLVNRSFYYSILSTIRYKNNLVLVVITITFVLTGLMIYVNPIAKFFAFESLSSFQVSLCMGIGFLSVIWFEIVKWRLRVLHENTPHR